MNFSVPISSEIKGVSFSFIDSETAKLLSVKRINNPITFDPTTGHPSLGGLYDPALGPTDRSQVCLTCKMNQFSCPGHFGHIELAVPAYHPLLFKTLFNLLRSTCLCCHSFKMKTARVERFQAKLKLLHNGMVLEAIELDKIDFGSTDDSNQNVDEEFICSNIEKYVKKAIDNVQSQSKNKYHGSDKVMLTNDVLRLAVKEFLSTAQNVKKCENCGAKSPTLRKEQNTKIFQQPLSKKDAAANAARGMQNRIVGMDETFDDNDHEDDEESDEAQKSKGMYLTPIEIQEHTKRLWEKEHEILDLLFGSIDESTGQRKSSYQHFFLEAVSVPPNRFRPISKLGDRQFDHAQNLYLGEIIKNNNKIIEMRHENKMMSKQEDMTEEQLKEAKENDQSLRYIINSWILLQENLNNFIDSTKNPKSKVQPPGIKQILEKKEGLFRKNMMGKRVNFAARSVISPDPMIETSEIGIPMVFAKKLTYPEPVTPYNIYELRQAIINGPDVYPGAVSVINEDGSLVMLKASCKDQRTAIANSLLTASSQLLGEDTAFVNKKVNRHLKNGDMLLLNRQPTLHKPSIMGHVARILPSEKTIRMHYANCNTYNADFDGDEMNVHFPQNPIAQCEARLIANTNNQYLVPTDGGPLRGLIQDHIVVGVKMTSRDTFLTKEQYTQLIYGALPDDGRRIRLVPPAMVKPKQLWTGKQAISTLLLNLTYGLPQLNMESKSQVPSKSWSVRQVVDTEEGAVIVMNGELLTGILDKKQFGAKPDGLVHSCFEVYGPDTAGKLLTALGRLFTKHSQSIGFTCRMDDLIVQAPPDEVRRQKIKQALSRGREILEDFAFGDKKDLAQEKSQLELNLQQVLNDNSAPKQAKERALKSLKALEDRKLYLALENTIRSDDKLAALDNKMKINTGAVTTDVVKSILPNGLYKPFPENGMQLMTVSGAKGSAVNVTQISCMLGQQELEGRRVPVQVSGKTLPCFRAFDLGPRAGGYVTGRFLTGIKPQEYYFHCMAGREGLVDTAVKTARSGYLQRCLIKHLEGLRVGYDHTVRDSADGSVYQFLYGEDSIDVTKSSFLNKYKFNALNFDSFAKKYNPAAAASALNTKKAAKHLGKSLKKPEKYDPALSLYSPSKNLGAVSEKFAKSLEEFVQKNADGIFVSEETLKKARQVNDTAFKALMHLKYLQCLVEPGEVCGLLAAQSIGEPSTQMTLNTFHFAGHGAANVTLGIPRLREIIMTASSKPKTPLMRIAFKPNVSRQEAEMVAKMISRLTLDMLVQEVSVSEHLTESEGADGRSRCYRIMLVFGKKKDYVKEHNISSELIQQSIEKKFAKKLVAAINKELKTKNQSQDDVGVGMDVNKFGESKYNTVNIEDSEDATTKPKKKEVKSIVEDDDENDMEMDAQTAARASKRKEKSSYDGPDDDEVVHEQESDDEEFAKPRKTAENPHEDLDNYNTQESTQIRREDMINNNMYISDYKFDDNGEWCQIELKLPAESKKLLMLGMTETIIPQCTVKEIPGITSSFVFEGQDGKGFMLATEGVNIQGIWEFEDYLDVNHIESNDVASILKIYGVEAARKTVIKEISSVFAVYGIEVDLRHLTLIADYMTFEGGYKPFNRMGIDSNVSPFAKMSFETSFGFLTNAALYSDYDALKNPSARIVMGQVVDGGTGSFEIMQNI